MAKLSEALDIVGNLPQDLRKQGFEALPVSIEHALAAGQLPGPHHDPFDRMLMAQAQLERAALVTLAPVFTDDGLPVIC